jgi:type II secretory pathway component PulF
MTSPASAATAWRYRASDAHGHESTGDIRAASAADAVASLRAQSLWVIELAPATGASMAAATLESASRGAPSGAWRERVAQLWSRVSGNEQQALAVLTRATATLLAAGVPLDVALAHAAGADSALHGEHQGAASATWRPIFAAWRERVRRGESLAEAAAATPTLPASFAPALAAAEATGSLAHTFDRLADHLERQVRTDAAIRAALVYPALLGVASVTGTLVILLVVVPRFAALLSDSGAALPWATRALMAAGALLTRGGWLLLVAVLVAAAALVRRWQTPAARHTLDAAQLRWPVIGAYVRERDAARYLETLALALGAGVPLLTAMRLARGAVHNREVAAQLAPAEPAVRDGGALASQLQRVIPALPLRLLEAGEAAGALPAMAARAADAADAAAQRRLAQLVALIEPVMILGFGGVVGFVALALLQAIYGINAGTL